MSEERAMRLGLVLLCGALGAPTAFVGAALAQDRADDSRGPESEIVVVTSPLEGARIESLQGAAILRRDDIVASLNGGLGDTLDSVPGVSTTFFGAGASRPIIRGLGDDRVRVLENGIGAIDASSASPDHAVTADGLDAERIEVLRGAAALAYGGNAIGGVVNVIDESIPTHAPADALSFDGYAAYNSGDQGRQGAADIAFGAGDLVFALSAAARDTEDYAIPDSETDEAPNSWTEFRASSAGASLVRDWGFIGLAVKRTENNYGLPPEAPDEAGGRIELEQSRIEARGDVRVDWGIFDRLDFAFQHADYEHAEIEGSGEVGTIFTNEGYEGRVEIHHSGGVHEGVTGLQIIDSDFAAEGEEAFITPTNTRDIGLFAVERWDNGAWGLEGGARYETRDIENLGGGDRSFETVSASAGAFLRPAENWFLGATLARTERAPTAIELFAEGPHLATASYEIGDADIGKETALSFEASLRHERDGFAFELNLYRVGFDDYVALIERGDVFWLDEANELEGFAPSEDDVSIPDGAELLPVFQFVQRDATFTGGEFSVSKDLFSLGAFRISADAALDLVRAEFDAGGRLPRIPPRSATLGLGADSNRLDARLELVDIAEQDRTAEFETATDGYTLLNARLVYRPGGEAGPVSFRLDARNLTDELARVHASFLKDELPLPGRSVRFAVVADF
jgi:iron complex outermembrane receptor protein